MSRTFIPNIDLRPMMSTVRSQGQRPTCVAFAVTSAHELFRRVNTHVYSEEFLFRLCKIRDKDYNDQEGTFVNLALMNLEKLGQSAANLMPYQNPISMSLHASIPIATFRNARQNRILKWGPINVNGYIQNIENEIMKERAVIAVIDTQESFYYAKQNGNFIDIPPIDKYKDNYHAIVLVGYGVDSNNEPYFIVRNSWGLSWGDQGYGFLSYKYFNRYQMGSWVIS